MMKRWWIYMLIALSVLAGCVDKSYAGMEDEEIFDDTTEPIPVKVYIGSAESILSKGVGVVDDIREWEGVKFYVYAFNNDMLNPFDVTSKVNISRCLIDGSKDVPGTMAGKEARMMATSNMVEWAGPDERVYYPYGSESGVIYDFFAYYVDDLKVRERDITRREDRVTIRVEIDGSQDLMSAKARVLEDQLAGFLDDKEKQYMEHYCYSYFAARRGIDPVFIFKHHLTKLNFRLKPAYNPTGNKKVTINRIEVKSQYKALFTVADRTNEDNLGLTFDDDDYANLAVKDSGQPGLEEGKYVLETLKRPDAPAVPLMVGTDLLVAPSEEFEAYIYMDEVMEDGTVLKHDAPQVVYLNTPEGFSAGNGYTVDVSVYGAAQLSVNVTLNDWSEGQDVTLDDEDRFTTNN